MAWRTRLWEASRGASAACMSEAESERVAETLGCARGGEHGEENMVWCGVGDLRFFAVGSGEYDELACECTPTRFVDAIVCMALLIFLLSMFPLTYLPTRTSPTPRTHTTTLSFSSPALPPPLPPSFSWVVLLRYFIRIHSGGGPANPGDVGEGHGEEDVQRVTSLRTLRQGYTLSSHLIPLSHQCHTTLHSSHCFFQPLDCCYFMLFAELCSSATPFVYLMVVMK